LRGLVSELELRSGVDIERLHAGGIGPSGSHYFRLMRGEVHHEQDTMSVCFHLANMLCLSISVWSKLEIVAPWQPWTASSWQSSPSSDLKNENHHVPLPPQLLTSIVPTPRLKMSAKKSPFNLQTCARPNILQLQPYRCARE
jgi:hypothetical protein